MLLSSQGEGMNNTARKAFWNMALGDNSKLANLAKQAIAEAEEQIIKEREECAKHFDALKGTKWFAENVAEEIRTRYKK